MWTCTECEKSFSVALAMQGPPPKCAPGVKCPHCKAFVEDWSAITEESEKTEC